MNYSTNIAAYRQDHGTSRQHVALESIDQSIDYTIDADGNATLDAAQLSDFFARDDVSFSHSERAEVKSYLESVAEGND